MGWNRSIAIWRPRRTPEAFAPLNAQRADLLEKLVDKANTPEEKATWIRQLADTVSAAVQAGGFPDGIQRLETIYKRLETEQAAPELVATSSSGSSRRITATPARARTTRKSNRNG